MTAPVGSMSGVQHGHHKATFMENLGALDWLGQGWLLIPGSGKGWGVPALDLGKKPCLRRAQPADPCLPADPSFIHAELIPDSAERNDDKLYFFFRERSTEAPQSPAVYARIGRICLVRGPFAAPSPGPVLAVVSPALAGSWG